MINDIKEEGAGSDTEVTGDGINVITLSTVARSRTFLINLYTMYGNLGEWKPLGF